VRTINYQGDTEIPVAYEMERREGSWRVTDIVIDEVSTADSYARSFQTVIRKRGFETLMQSLRKKLKTDAASQEESST
jgi:phospholipid transport system substrate-binding protein